MKEKEGGGGGEKRHTTLELGVGKSSKTGKSNEKYNNRNHH